VAVFFCLAENKRKERESRQALPLAVQRCGRLSQQIVIFGQYREDKDLDIGAQVVGGVQIVLCNLAVQPDQNLLSTQRQEAGVVHALVEALAA